MALIRPRSRLYPLEPFRGQAAALVKCRVQERAIRNMHVIMKPISEMLSRACASAHRLVRDRSGIAAVEFAMILPVMLVLLFGTVEFSSGVEVDRKVNLIAHTLSDLTSQSPTTGISDTELGFFFSAGATILLPYSSSPLNQVIPELYIDPASGNAYVQWSKPFQGGVARAK